MKLAIFNNNGIGNGIIIFPLIKITPNGSKLIHIDNLFLKESNGNLENLIGFFPKEWRRFKQVDETLKYFEMEGIEKIVNVRKETRNFDQNYFEFKKIATRYFDVFDLYDNNINNSDAIANQCRTVFENAFGELKDLSWYFNDGFYVNNSNILFYVGSNIPGKCLNYNQIKKIHDSIREITANSKICICAGNTNYEIEQVAYLSQIIKNQKTQFHNFRSIEEAKNCLMKYGTVLTMDTYMSHLAGSTHADTYTIFIRTNGKIWRNATQPNSNIFQSEIPLLCEEMKPDGTCLGFYTNCTGCTGEDLDLKEIGYTVGKSALRRTTK